MFKIKDLKIILIIITLFVMVSFEVYSGTSKLIIFDCPIGKGIALGEKKTSFSYFNKWLDGEPVGPGAFPLPPPECKENGFLVFKKNFTNSEKEILQKFIFSDEYQILRENKVSFYRLAKIYEKLNYPLKDYIFLYLVSTWNFNQLEKDLLTKVLFETNVSKKQNLKNSLADIRKKYKFYATHAISKFLQITKINNQRTEILVDCKYYLAELNRRLGNFEEAKLNIEWVYLNNNNFINKDLIKFQLFLINKQNSNPYLLSEIKKNKIHIQ